MDSKHETANAWKEAIAQISTIWYPRLHIAKPQ